VVRLDGRISKNESEILELYQVRFKRVGNIFIFRKIKFRNF